MEKEVKKRAKGKGRGALKAVLWTILGLWLLVMVIIQLALTPKVLSKAVHTVAREYLDGSVSFSGIKASMLRSFPNLEISVDDFTLTYPHSRFAPFDSVETAGDSLCLAGWGPSEGTEERIDTLASFARLRASVNYMEALRKKIRVPHVILERPRIFIHQYDSTAANWNVIRLEGGEDDDSSFVMPPLSIGKVSLEKDAHAVYTCAADTLALALDMDHLTLKSHHDHYDIDLETLVTMALAEAGRMELPVSLKGKFMPDFDKNAYAVENLRASVATIDFTADGKTVIGKDSIFVKADLAVKDEPVKEVTEYFGKNFPVLLKLDTDARISLDAGVDGYYVISTGEMPPMSVRMGVPDARLGWEGIKEKGRFDLEATATVVDGKLTADVPDLCFHIDGADITLKGSADDILGGDPRLNVDGRLHLKLDTLVRFLPEDLGVRASGNLDGKVKGAFRLSQLDIYNFDRMGITANLVSDGIRIRDPKDSIFAFLGHTTIALGPYTPAEGDEEEGNHTALSATIDTLLAEYGKSTFIRGTGVSLAAHNEDETIEGSPGRHPIHGHLEMASAGMRDLDSCFVGVRGSKNVFELSLIPKNGRNVPYLSFSSKNRSVAVRESKNSYYAKGVALQASAHPASQESRDTLTRPRRTGVKLPDFLSEKDFQKKDISLSLGDGVAKYVRDWDISGSARIDEGRITTPSFPLENKVSGFAAKFTNNSLNLSGLTLQTGSSDLSARGSLTGIRRALTTGRGRLILDLDLTSERIDLNEILAAIGSEGKESVKDTVTETSLIVIPANLNARVGVQAGSVKISDLETSFVSTNLEMKERCLQMTNTLAMTNMGEVFLEGFYSTRTKKDIKAGFDLMLSNITAEKVIQLFPAVDSIVPMLKAFKGLLDCEIAATSAIDTTMNIMLPTLNGMIKIDGKNLSLSESEDLDKLRKTLMFKDKDSSYIDKMSVRGIVKDNQLEVFPFILKVDRYTLALNGLQGFDQKFKYHVAAIKSPVPFRFGVNLGGTFDSWRWKLGKAKYKSVKVPLFDDEIDGLRLNLVSSIHNIFDRGIEQAMRRNEEAQQAIEEKKAEVDYSVEETEELSADEKKALETLGGGES